MLRVLRPFGGTIYIGQPDGVSDKLSEKEMDRWMKSTLIENWEVSRDNGLWVTMRRGKLPGAGQWNHQYADAANTACSNDELMSNDMQLQWFGRPRPPACTVIDERPPVHSGRQEAVWHRCFQRYHSLDIGYSGN